MSKMTSKTTELIHDVFDPLNDFFVHVRSSTPFINHNKTNYNITFTALCKQMFHLDFMETRRLFKAGRSLDID
jgi:hypothetical protein